MNPFFQQKLSLNNKRKLCNLNLYLKNFPKWKYVWDSFTSNKNLTEKIARAGPSQMFWPDLFGPEFSARFSPLDELNTAITITARSTLKVTWLYLQTSWIGSYMSKTNKYNKYFILKSVKIYMTIAFWPRSKQKFWEFLKLRRC